MQAEYKRGTSLLVTLMDIKHINLNNLSMLCNVV